MDSYHIPVMLKECIEGLNINPEGVYVDVTFGGGGHSREILKHLGKNGRLIAFDQDEDAKGNILDDERLIFVPQNFRYLKRFLRLEGYKKVDGILADLGISSHQIDEAERGFSYRFDAILDMRMNQQGIKTAAEIVNTYEAGELQRIFGMYGEVKNARTLAELIVSERDLRPIQTINDFVNTIGSAVRGKRPKYLAQVFQALRIEVNEEIEALNEFLESTLDTLKIGGRLVVMSYHSLEDRPVKNFIKRGTLNGKMIQDDFGKIYKPFKLINKGVIEATAEEVKINSRARSSKLRIAERLKDNISREQQPIIQ
ncbi:MAG: 16S rRNA (cytosine(1402)-N(4))-methyltransferase RsmH [Saprospiraceae bacterium]